MNRSQTAPDHNAICAQLLLDGREHSDPAIRNANRIGRWAIINGIGAASPGGIAVAVGMTDDDLHAAGEVLIRIGAVEEAWLNGHMSWQFRCVPGPFSHVRHLDGNKWHWLPVNLAWSSKRGPLLPWDAELRAGRSAR